MTSLGGQWIGPYTGSNAGRFVIELDEAGDHYEGTAVAWDEKPGNLHALIRFGTSSKGNVHHIENIPVTIINGNGDAVSAEFLKSVKDSSGIIYPATVTVDIELSGKNLSIKWESSIGTHGSGIAAVPKTRDGEKSNLGARRLNTWDGFKKAVNRLEAKRYIFRGQENSEWRLRSSFYRSGRANLEKYLLRDVADLQKVFSIVSPHTFNLNDPLQYGAFLNLAQHHGYPTPLLDWTWSPYIAAFFAFHKISKQSSAHNRNKIRIFKFDLLTWNRLSRAKHLFPIWPNITILDALAFGNPRAIPQQSISTTSNVDDIEAYIQEMERKENIKYLEALDLPASERNHVMRELALMGITAGSLFPGLDGACEGLRERNF
jgi:hypothetical protein